MFLLSLFFCFCAPPSIARPHTIGILYGCISQKGHLSVSPRHPSALLFSFGLCLFLCAILGLDFIGSSRYGRRAGTGDDVDSYDVDISVLRPRTVGYSPGHVRTVAQRAAAGPASPGPPPRAGTSSAPGSSLTSASLLSGSASADDRGSSRSASAAPRGTSRAFPHPPSLSSTARRLEYCNVLHAAMAAQLERQQQRRGEVAVAKAHAALSGEVAEGIGCFECQLAELKAKGWKGV
jgi:hypothetical protein